jgi:hypothetical protein
VPPARTTPAPVLQRTKALPWLAHETRPGGQMALNLRLQHRPSPALLSPAQPAATARASRHNAPAPARQVSSSALVLRLDGLNGGFDPNSDFYKHLSRGEAFAVRSGKDAPRTVRVRLSVHYRVHSRQMLCIGGSQIPFGWSFLSIAKVPMPWNQGDVWICEVGGWSGLAAVLQRSGTPGRGHPRVRPPQAQAQAPARWGSR